MGSLLDLAPPAIVTDSLNKVTTITVNTQGQPLTIKDPLNNITTFTYELGDLISVKDPLNRTSTRIVPSARPIVDFSSTRHDFSPRSNHCLLATRHFFIADSQFLRLSPLFRSLNWLLLDEFGHISLDTHSALQCRPITCSTERRPHR